MELEVWMQTDVLLIYIDKFENTYKCTCINMHVFFNIYQSHLCVFTYKNYICVYTHIYQ